MFKMFWMTYYVHTRYVHALYMYVCMYINCPWPKNWVHFSTLCAIITHLPYVFMTSRDQLLQRRKMYLFLPTKNIPDFLTPMPRTYILSDFFTTLSPNSMWVERHTIRFFPSLKTLTLLNWCQILELERSTSVF